MTQCPPRCPRVAPLVLLAALAVAGCTSRWAIRGDVDLTGDGSAAALTQQSDPLLADPRPEPSPAPE